jgi:YVTN family beta-propeller protein
MDIVARCALMLAIICGTLWPLPAAEASDRVYVTNLGGSLSIYNSATEKVTTSFFTSGLFPTAVAITPNGAYAYIAVLGANRVVVITTDTGRLVASIRVEEDPIGIAFTRDGAFAFVTNSASDSVSVIATATYAVVNTIRVPAGCHPYKIAIFSSQPQVSSLFGVGLVTCPESGSVVVIDTDRQTLRGSVFIGENTFPTGITFRAAFPTAYVSDDRFGLSQVEPFGFTFDHFEFYRGERQFLPTTGITLTPNDRFLFATANGQDNVGVVAVFTITDDAPPVFYKTIPVGLGPRAIAFEARGSLGYVLNAGSNSMSVVNTDLFQVVGREIPVGAAPYDLAILPHPDPIINFNVTYNELSKFGSLFDLTGLISTFSVPVDDPSLVASVTWDFYGDGTAIRSTTTLDTQFTYPQAGTFTPTVTVFFTDGTQASRTMSLVVQSPADAMGTTTSMVDWLALPDGITNSLVTKLDAAALSFTRGSHQAACGQMQAFENELHARVQGGQLADGASAPLLGETAAIRVSLGCQ